ncbi:unnamed protein product [Arabidopsis lyrata]|uniref:RING-type E3 ubiquitin transferase n=1 Tax=Arabidopsis lyrata subsp. lyrata TaxID=81972 RepID=D7KBH8_ARALL|nr:E3 ubiquitin-protein ligase RNF181 [Arabidopsis lyrata subsp. lyrata]EFH69053.1 zinc finger family protein [Arabidopsis lyrata subsp. lyrata]CAH8252275.1 unnamed protein product [Arabidopsis lyrata]|eukprot:XP_002892794.1 E3 ubiquitin-protein ligase RNF181 [Arabidopsis lyrata subsp. lyrata]
MSSENDFAEFSSFFERMIQGGGDGLSRFLPVIVALAAREDDDDQESSNQTTNPRLVMIRSGYGLDDFFSGGEKQGRSPASKSAVENMPRVVIGEDKEKDGGSCAICLEEWSKGDVATEMPCKHKFHSKCVEEWLGMHATCPMCRYEMPVEEVEEEKKVGIWIGFSINAGERRNAEDGGRRS